MLLPMVGDNLSRQLGLSGAPQGLLLLISPPGYGKTTLVEYVADLLGFALVKINGPALGEGVTSLMKGAGSTITLWPRRGRCIRKCKPGSLPLT